MYLRRITLLIILSFMFFVEDCFLGERSHRLNNNFNSARHYNALSQWEKIACPVSLSKGF